MIVITTRLGSTSSSSSSSRWLSKSWTRISIPILL